MMIFRGENASKAYTQAETGEWLELGGGNGRCQCSDGWMGPYCNLPTNTSVVVPNPLPSPTQTGPELESWLERLCAEVAPNEASNLATVCPKASLVLVSEKGQEEGHPPPPPFNVASIFWWSNNTKISKLKLLTPQTMTPGIS